MEDVSLLFVSPNHAKGELHAGRFPVETQSKTDDTVLKCNIIHLAKRLNVVRGPSNESPGANNVVKQGFKINNEVLTISKISHLAI